MAVTCRSLFVVASLACVAACSSPEQARTRYVANADRYFANGQYKEAIVEYRNALQQDPKYGPARYQLAEAYYRTDDLRNAFREYVRAADAMPGNLEAQLKAAYFLLGARQFEDARARARAALQIDPRSAQAHMLLGSALAGLRDVESAIKQVEEATRVEPSSTAAFTSLGAIQLAGGTPAAAEAAFRRAIELDPANATARLALAQYWWTRGRRLETEQELTRAIELEPDNVLGRRMLAAFQIASGRPSDAEPHLRRLAELDTLPSAPMRLQLADYYAAMRQPARAREVLDSLRTRDLLRSAVDTRLASVAYSERARDTAHQLLGRVLERDPHYIPALLLQARMRAADRDTAGALRSAQAAMRADAASLEAHYLVGLLHRRRGELREAIVAFTDVLKLNPLVASAQVQLSELNLMIGARDEARGQAQAAARQFPDDPGVQLALARSFLAGGEHGAARDVLARLTSRFPRYAIGHAVTGTANLSAGRWREARAAFDRALALDPSQLEALSGSVALDIAEHHPGTARRRVDAQLAKRPDDVGLLMLGGRVAATMADLEASERYLRRAIVSDPAQLHAYSLLGELYARQGRIDQAMATFGSIARQQPRSVAAHTVLAVLHELKGSRQDARRGYERVLQIDPSAPVAANNLAYLYAEDGGNLDVALQLAETARRKLPDVPEVADTVGWVFVKRGMPNLAIPLLEDCVRQNKKNAAFAYHLGAAYAKAGQRERSRELLEKSVALGLTEPDRQRALQIMSGP
jgi:putative PEP-CTERM system TPR-repeat lipoprotein